MYFRKCCVVVKGPARGEAVAVVAALGQRGVVLDERDGIRSINLVIGLAEPRPAVDIRLRGALPGRAVRVAGRGCAAAPPGALVVRRPAHAEVVEPHARAFPPGRCLYGQVEVLEGAVAVRVVYVRAGMALLGVDVLYE
jgi:hypothetical protein